MILISYVRPLILIHSSELLSGELILKNNTGKVIETYNVSNNDFFFSVEIDLKNETCITALFQSANERVRKRIFL